MNKPDLSHLSHEQHRVTQCGGTEVPFSGVYYDHHEVGAYRCICCQNVLFQSDHKFESGTGWPSFWETSAPNALKTIRDTSHGMIRTEVRCQQCDAHLGHVFPDGPAPTGLRYCINSASLDFMPENP